MARVSDEKRQRHVHAWLVELKHSGSGATVCVNDDFDAIVEPKDENMSVMVGKTWFKAEATYSAYQSLLAKALVDGLGSVDRLMINIMVDSGIIFEERRREQT